jgi:hypothetical protein
MKIQLRAVGGGDPRALLPAMLEGKDTEEGNAGYVFAGGVDSEDSAAFIQVVQQPYPFEELCGSGIRAGATNASPV